MNLYKLVHEFRSKQFLRPFLVSKYVNIDPLFITQQIDTNFSCLLSELGASGKPVVNVMNKCDQIYDLNDIPSIQNTVYISALRGNGIDKLLTAIENALPKDRVRRTFLFPYNDLKPASIVRDDGNVFSEEYVDEGLKIDALTSIIVANKLEKYILE